jgi:cytochrome P450
MSADVTTDSPPHVAGFATTVAEMQELFASSRVATSDRGFEVLGYETGLDVLSSKQFNKAAQFRMRLDAVGITEGQIRKDWESMIPASEGEQRERLRTLFAGMMRPGQIAKLKQAVNEIVVGVFDELESNGTVDLMQEIAWKVPSRVYCHLVSAPYDFAPEAARLSDSALSPVVTRDISRRQESIDAFNETIEFVRAHLDARRDNLTDDFTSHMIRQQMEGRVTERELLLSSVGLLHASIDNTVHQMGLVFGMLLERRDVWDALVADPELVPAAVEEAMRLAPRFNVVIRVADEDVEIDGHAVAAGTEVYVWVPTAQRDPELVDHPDEFRLDRTPLRNLEFGGGNHNCLGQHLARLEFHEVVSTLVRRFPAARLVDGWSTKEFSVAVEVPELIVMLQ